MTSLRVFGVAAFVMAISAPDALCAAERSAAACAARWSAEWWAGAEERRQAPKSAS